MHLQLFLKLLKFGVRHGSGPGTLELLNQHLRRGELGRLRPQQLLHASCVLPHHLPAWVCWKCHTTLCGSVDTI